MVLISLMEQHFCGFDIYRNNSFIVLVSLMGRPWWLSQTGDQEVAGLIPDGIGNVLSWRLIMKYFLWSFSPFRCFKESSCQFLVKECAQVLVKHLLCFRHLSESCLICLVLDPE